jgi:hypothetical protein
MQKQASKQTNCARYEIVKAVDMDITVFLVGRDVVC